MKSQRSRGIAGDGTPSPSDFCEFFPPEFRTACDPYCWACAPPSGGSGTDPRSPHGPALGRADCARAGAHRAPPGQSAIAIIDDPEDLDFHPYFWDLKQEICPCP